MVGADSSFTAGPGWEWCPDCGSYFRGAHICEKSRDAVLERVEARLDQIAERVEGLSIMLLYLYPGLKDIPPPIPKEITEPKGR